MRHPYGIWNFTLLLITAYLEHYETSLWDLKPIISLTVNISAGLWDIPMGFETRNTRHTQQD